MGLIGGLIKLSIFLLLVVFGFIIPGLWALAGLMIIAKIWKWI
jgi:hypothetical protein